MPLSLLRNLGLNAGVVVVAVLVVLLWIGALWVAPPAEKEGLKLAVSMRPAAETFILAREAGEIPADEVNYVEMNWTSAAMRAVGNRVVDAAVLSLDEVIRQRAQGYPLKIVLVTDISRGGDVLLAKPGVTQVEQLRRLRVGYEPRTASAWLLAKALRETGLAMTDVEQVPVNPAETEDIFDTLQLDAVVTADPWRQHLDKFNLHTLYDSAATGAEITRVLAVHETALVDHPGAVALLVRQHLKWSTRMLESESLLIPILRREGLDRHQFEQALRSLEMPGREQNVRWLTQQDDGLNRRLLEIAEELQKDEPSLRGVDLTGLFEPLFVQQAP